jgi:His-Xaa-Ser system protein HxsD
MEEKYNFKIDHQNQSVTLEVSSTIFPAPIVLLAAYCFIDGRKIIVDRANGDKLTVTFIPNKKSDEAELAALAYDFNVQLITSFAEEETSKKHAGIRDAMMKAALSPQWMPSDHSRRPEKNEQNKTC